MQSLKNSIKRRFPQFCMRLHEVKRQVRVEYKVLRQIGVRTLLRGDLWRRASWREVLPLQKVWRIRFADGAFTTLAQLTAQMEATGLRFSAGGQTVYFPPDTIEASVLRELREHYPADVGVKIVRDPGDIATSHYISRANHSSINRRLTSNHGRLTLAANLLHLSALGPRLYDLVELECDGTVWTAYVVQHVEGRQPTADECQEGLGRLQSLEAQGLVKVTLPNGWNNEDFQIPKCNRNALVDVAGNFHYVDFQNFVLADYEAFLKRLAVTSVESTHFGTESLIRRGRFLYQSIPGVRLPARRNIQDRFSLISKLMVAAGLSVQDRLVLDIGCNIGMMMGEYLKAGARWCHGWDRAKVTPHSERLLLALGCTRFSLTGGDINRDRRLEDDIPSFLSLSGCVVSYLAVRMHMGWLEALGRIPWAFLIYEGHQGEDRQQLDCKLAEFRQIVEFDVVGAGSYKDGMSDDRFVAVLRRNKGAKRHDL
jgi:hypothetical protein